MKAGGGKAKGSEFERLCCKKLSLWLSDNKRDDLLWRSAMSGGRASVQFKKGKKNTTQVGDISAIHKTGAKLTDKFVVEIKSYKDLYLNSLIYGTPKNDSIIEFWETLYKIAKKVHKQPMLIAKQNFKQELICLDNDIKIDQLTPLAIFPFYGINIYDFESFLKLVDMKKFLK